MRVALIRLPVANLRRHNPIRFFDERGQVRELPHLRLRVSILVGKDPPNPSADDRRSFPAVLDTGAPISIFPKNAWQMVLPEISRVRLVEERVLTGAAAGRRYSYFLGRVLLGAIDLWERRLRAVSVLAQFREDDTPKGEPSPPILLGLWGGILEGRTLTRWPTVERYDADLPTLESFGQWWCLADS
jgi:hypothetical protein